MHIDSANLSTASELLIDSNVKKYKNRAAELKLEDLIQQVLHHQTLTPLWLIRRFMLDQWATLKLVV